MGGQINMQTGSALSSIGTGSAALKQSPFTVGAGKQRAAILQEGQALIVTGAAGTTGTVQRLDAAGAILQSWTIGYGTLPQIGPYAGVQRFLISCSAGSVDATVGDAVLGAGTLSAGSGNLITSSGGLVPIGAPAKSIVFAAQPFSAAPSSATANFTFITNVPCPAGDFYAVQLVLENHSSAGTLTVDAATVTAIATALATGFGNTFIPVTFGGATSVVIPVATGTSTNTIPGRVVSDVIILASIPRTDSGTMPLLQARVFHSGTPTTMAVGAGATGTFNKYRLATGAEYAMGYSGGNATTGGAVTVSEANNIIDPAAVIFYTQNPRAVIGQVGDSLSTGLGSSGGNLNSLALAQYKSGFKFSYRSRGIPSQLHSASYATGLDLLAEGGIQALVFWAMSPNDTPTQAVFDKSWGETLSLAQKCKSAGVVPIICTSGPKNAFTAPQNALLLAQNARARAFCATGAAILSDNAMVLDPTGSGTIVPAYDSGDGLHYNDAGYQAICDQQLYPAILRII